MRYFCVCLAVLFSFQASSTYAQELLTSIAAFGSFTTSSKLFLHPNDPDETVRGQYLPLNTIFSAGIELRREFKTLGAQAGISIEYIHKANVYNVPALSALIPVNDGYTVIPIELTGYFIIPIGNERLHVYLGGGAGMYAGTRIHEYPGATATTIERNIGYGIHVLTGSEYFLQQSFSVRGELKFRDVQFNAVNQFSQSSIIYKGAIYSLDQEKLPSRLNIDGMTGTISIAFHF
jgi:hypothetical protein